MSNSKTRTVLFSLAIAAILAFVVYEIVQYRKSKAADAGEAMATIDPEFASYISSFTSGFISTTSSIRIKLSKELSGSTQLNTPVKEKYFSFDPSIEGETVWKDAQTLEFIPKEPLKPGQSYEATFYLGRLTEVKDALREFDFRFQTIQQSLQLQAN